MLQVDVWLRFQQFDSVGQAISHIDDPSGLTMAKLKLVYRGVVLFSIRLPRPWSSDLVSHPPLRSWLQCLPQLQLPRLPRLCRPSRIHYKRQWLCSPPRKQVQFSPRWRCHG
jgi:hypothetical protein